MGLPGHTDALPTEAGATVNYRLFPDRSTGSKAAQGDIPHFLGRFRILGEIARGGMGVVLRAYDPTLDRELAVKLLSPTILPESEAGRRFAQEARVVSQLHHPGVIPVFEAGTLPDGRAYFAMPFIEGRNLSAWLAERPDPSHDRDRWLRVFERVCDTVAHVHAEGVVHRDLKPSNVMVGRFGEAMLMDWGVAALVEAPGVGRPGVWVFGTPAYMPPEQARGKAETPDRLSDVFGLGAILCEILTGQPPYTGPDVPSITRRAANADLAETMQQLDASGADADVVRLAKRCLAPDPADRPKSAAEVGRAIADYLSAAECRALAAVERSQVVNERKDRRFAGLLTAILVLGAVFCVAATARESRARAGGRVTSPDSAQLLTPNPGPPSGHHPAPVPPPP